MLRPTCGRALIQKVTGSEMVLVTRPSGIFSGGNPMLDRPALLNCVTLTVSLFPAQATRALPITSAISGARP
jgi:hypothetical protein